MNAGTILFNGTDLRLFGTPRFTMRKTPSPPPPDMISHWQVDIVVTVDLSAEMPATIWRRIQKLQEILMMKREGILIIADENNIATTWTATPGENSIPQAIERRRGKMEISFSATEPAAAADDNGVGTSMSIVPFGESTTINVERVMDWQEQTRVARPDSRSNVRQEIAGTINFTARSAYADMTQTEGDRAEQLMNAAEAIKAVSAKEAVVVYAGASRLVQFESVDAHPSPGWQFLEIKAQARYAKLPSNEKAEVTYNTDSSMDPATGMTRHVFSGNIRAATKTIANDRMLQLITGFKKPAMRLVRMDAKDAWLSGTDSDQEWTGRDFTAEFNELPEKTHYTLKIDSQEGSEGGRTSYSGTACASSLSVLQSTIASAAGAKHPICLRQEISVEYATDENATQQLVSATFNYEYQVTTKLIYGTASRRSNQQRYGEWESSISGSITAPTEAIARTTARKLIPEDKTSKIREMEETSSNTLFNAAATESVAQLFTTLNFNYTWKETRDNCALRYEDSCSNDYSRMIQSRTISGTVWAPTQTAAEAAITVLRDILCTAPANRGVRGKVLPSTESTGHSFEGYYPSNKTLTMDVLSWMSVNFSMTVEVPVSKESGHDIIECGFSIQRIGMIGNIPITEVPFGKPITQTPPENTTEDITPPNFGFNTGRLVISGSVKARQQLTAIQWGTAKRDMAKNVFTTGTVPTASAEDAPDETLTPVYLPFNGDVCTLFEFRFQYSFRFADGLLGSWPQSLLVTTMDENVME